MSERLRVSLVCLVRLSLFLTSTLDSLFTLLVKGRNFDELEEQFQLFVRELEDEVSTPPIARDFDLLGF